MNESLFLRLNLLRSLQTCKGHVAHITCSLTFHALVSSTVNTAVFRLSTIRLGHSIYLVRKNYFPYRMIYRAAVMLKSPLMLVTLIGQWLSDRLVTEVRPCTARICPWPWPWLKGLTPLWRSSRRDHSKRIAATASVRAGKASQSTFPLLTILRCYSIFTEEVGHRFYRKNCCYIFRNSPLKLEP